MLNKTLLICFAFVLTACGGGGGSQNPSSQGSGSMSSVADSLLPISLVDTKITLVDSEIYESSSGKSQLSTDKTILMFDSQKLVVHSLDGRTLPSIYGYSYLNRDDTAWITSTQAGDGYAFNLKFQDKTSGTFQASYTGFDGVKSLIRTGTFKLENKVFSLLPDNIINTSFHLDFKTATATLPIEESPIVEERFKMSFQADGSVVVQPSNLPLTIVNANYLVTPKNAFTLEVKGVYSDTKHPFTLTTTFDSLTTGTFTLDIDQGKAIASGNFDTIKFTPIEKFALKGVLTERATITSQNTKVTYGFTVYLPAGYDHSGKNYPIIYVTDGQWYTDFAYILDKKSKDVIMVAIDEGHRGRRMKDFLFEGSPLYTKFLKEEFIPLIEATYRGNSERTFVGVSAGGLLGAYLLSIEPVGSPYFKNYMLIDGAMFGVTAPTIAAEEQRFNLSKSLAVHVLLAGTPQGNGWFVNAYEKRYSSRSYNNFQISNKEFRVTHDEMGPLAFDALIDSLY